MVWRIGVRVFLVVACLTASVMAQDLSVIRAYKTTAAPTIDGMISPGEWDAAGPPIVIAPTEGVGSAFPEDPFGGPEDLSFQFRVMWEEPWRAYFLFEVTDDIPMDIAPSNAWEQDQIEFFMDGDDLEGSDELETFQWWNNSEIYGKFGASRWQGVFEGNTGVMTEFPDDLYEDGFGSFAATQVTETGHNGDYVVEYVVTLEPMLDHGTFDGTPTADAGQIVQDSTVVKWTVCISDDDNFGDGTRGRSHTVCAYRARPDADWRDTTAFADLLFVGPYTTATPGDFDGDGDLDVADVDALTAGTAANDVAFDLNGDGAVDAVDRQVWVKDLRNTWFGDANLDGEFNSSDFVSVFQTGKFEIDSDASWGEGDWNGDNRFNSSDFVVAFQDGGFEQGPRAAVAAVPEPTGLGLLALPFLLTLVAHRARRR